MPELTCFRLLDAESPAGPLAEAVRQVNAGQGGAAVFTLDPVSFEQVPNAPFAYWVEEKVRQLFNLLPNFESEYRTARQGLATADDFRFVRCWWEAPIEVTGAVKRRWYPFAKGGSYSPHYADLHLVIDWQDEGKILGMVGNHTPSKQYYFLPGLTWPRRTDGLSFRLLPKGCIFADKGPAAFCGKYTIAVCALINSRCFGHLVSVQLARVELAQSFEVGIIQNTPMPVFDDKHGDALEAAVIAIWNRKHALDTSRETSHAFVFPCLTNRVLLLGQLEADLAKAKAELSVFVEEQQACIDQIAEQLYGFKVPQAPISSEDEEKHIDEDEGPAVSFDAARAISSYLVGVAFGRWDIPANPEELRRPPADPFAPLPAQAPGAAPAEAARLYFAEDVSAESPLLHSCRDALRAATGLASIDGYEQDLAARLGVPALRDYFSRPASFFADHLSVYSKSRRKAPIYWPLSTRSGEFVIWVYYPKLEGDSLTRLITEVLDPRLRRLNEELGALAAEGRVSGRKAKLESLRLELAEMRQDFQELIAKGYQPNLNDGVLITACPLAKYFRHAGFRKNLEACWKGLSRGEYDWSHLAMSMWPERVLAACKKDRSIAIAHGREDLCPAEPAKVSRGRKKKAD
jgi:hypothetical protein